MTATYDPELTARLIAEAKEDDARMSKAPWSSENDEYLLSDADGEGWCAVARLMRGRNGPGIARARNNLAPMAD